MIILFYFRFYISLENVLQNMSLKNMGCFTRFFASSQKDEERKKESEQYIIYEIEWQKCKWIHTNFLSFLALVQYFGYTFLVLQAKNVLLDRFFFFFYFPFNFKLWPKHSKEIVCRKFISSWYLLEIRKQFSVPCIWSN